MPHTKDIDSPELAHGNTQAPWEVLLVLLVAGREERPPLGAALLENVSEILLPHHAVLLLILHDRALQSRRQILWAHFAAAEVARQRHAAGQHRNRFCGRKHAARCLEL